MLERVATKQIRRRSRLGAGLLLLLLFTVVLSACGGQSASTNTTETANDDGGTRVIKHAMGETKVPAHPKRVVVLDTGELDAAISLGIKPVGAVTSPQAKDQTFLSYLGDQTKGITSVGTLSQPNLEKIMSLNPDLILSNKFRHEKLYDQLSQIAPTVFSENVGPTWKENLKLFADALNRMDEYNKLMDAYNKRLADFKQKMGDKLEKTHVSVVRTMPDRVRLYLNGVFLGIVLKDAGLPRTKIQDSPKKFIEMTSFERIKDMDGDVIFTMHYGSDQKLKELTSQPQWKELNAVKNGRVYEVSDDIWALGMSMGAANKIIDDLYTYLVK
uniref:Iron siderophore-binding protein n=1 Tax=Thermosporothrix sp. COM3 TaxID=2490863 RepID=A0A455SE47_9CHLR|nr:iron siderophore-binding protein [Thermosporothrix sp. COM3]